jgi:hypothetical protein
MTLYKNKRNFRLEKSLMTIKKWTIRECLVNGIRMIKVAFIKEKRMNKASEMVEAFEFYLTQDGCWSKDLKKVCRMVILPLLEQMET